MSDASSRNTWTRGSNTIVLIIYLGSKEAVQFDHLFFELVYVVLLGVLFRSFYLYLLFSPQISVSLLLVKTQSSR
jgi:hypothetical protein